MAELVKKKITIYLSEIHYGYVIDSGRNDLDLPRTVCRVIVYV